MDEEQHTPFFTLADLKGLVENISDIVCSFRMEPVRRVEYMNAAVVKWTFYHPEEFYQDLDLFMRIIHPDDRAHVEGMLCEGHPERAFFRICRKDGLIFSVEGSFTDIYHRDSYLMAIRAVLRVNLKSKSEEPPAQMEPAPSVELSLRMARYVEELEIVSDIGRTLADTLNLPDIYRRLAQAVQRLFPDPGVLFISKYRPDLQEITCIYALIDGTEQDVSGFPVVALDPSPRATQSQAILQRKALVIPDLVAHRGGVQNLGTLLGGETDTEQVPRSAMVVPMLSQNNVLGVVQLQSFERNRFSDADARLLAVVANTAATVLQNALLLEDLLSSNAQLKNAYDRTLEGWVRALDLRDQETEEHSLRVATLTFELAVRLGVAQDLLTHLWRGALLHDIGKLGVPDAILLKPGRLTDEEWVVMRRHPQLAYDMLKPISYLEFALDIPYAHHEKWDGSGYPRGLREEEIPLGARIFAVVDVWDALLSDRAYRRAWEKTTVVAHLQANSGSHFDPRVVEAFLGMVQEAK